MNLIQIHTSYHLLILSNIALHYYPIYLPITSISSIHISMIELFDLTHILCMILLICSIQIDYFGMELIFDGDFINCCFSLFVTRE